MVIIKAKDGGVVAGLSLTQVIFDVVDPTLSFQHFVADGESVGQGAVMSIIKGSVFSMLQAERVALNYLQHLCGIATYTDTIVGLISGTNCQLRDTRKTTPGLRIFEKNAVNVEASSKVDLNNLMKKVRDEEKKSKRASVYVSAAAVSALAVFGIILTL